jgi:hypothetical protein
MAATLYNTRQCFGFVVHSASMTAELTGFEPGAGMTDRE